MNKILIISLIVLALLVVLMLTGKKSVHHEVEINASPEKVWDVLSDTDTYKDWNPVMQLLEGEIAEGNRVTYQFTQDADNISEIASTVKQVVDKNYSIRLAVFR